MLSIVTDYTSYPGRFVARERGKHLSQRALERHRADYELAEGESDQPLLVTRHFLPLSTHPRNDWNQLWLLTTIEHQGKQPQVLEESVTSHSDSSDGFTQGYRNRLTATPWDVPFRPALAHPKAKILGSQTAKVMHSDLGGGYRPCMTEKLLISPPRSVSVTLGRPLERSNAWRETQMAIRQLEQRGLPGDGEIKPVYKYFATTGQHGNNSQNQRAIVVASIKREVRGELSRVYLRIMRALAVKHEVPFKEIPDNTSFAIPSDLQAIAEKITAGVMGQGERLSTTEEQHLHARYIHLSAHWTPSKGLLINKPANERQIYRNSPQGGYPE